MTDDDAIVLRGLTKRFPRSGRTPARRLLGDVGRAALGRSPRRAAAGDEFAAVNGLELRVGRGEALALVGRNGCGKTTTLRLVAGLLRPDAGSVEVRGRLQALIALGAGFHDRLSGLENIRNNAAVLGMGARATRDIVDAVVAFAEIPDAIHSPVETYSSGMRARLGYAVAVHLKPDVLIIDEILGVGDFAFQNKCAAHMAGLLERGVTILLVSHSHNSVIRLCSRAAWLEAGRLRMLGPAKEVVKAYLDDTQATAAAAATPRGGASGGPQAGLYGPELPADPAVRGFELEAPAEVLPHTPVRLTCSFELLEEMSGLNLTVDLFTQDGVKLTAISTVNGDLLAAPRVGCVLCVIDVPSLPLNPGVYVWTVSLARGLTYLLRGEQGRFRVPAGPRMSWALLDLDPRIRVKDPDPDPDQPAIAG